MLLKSVVDPFFDTKVLSIEGVVVLCKAHLGSINKLLNNGLNYRVRYKVYVLNLLIAHIPLSSL